MNKKGLIGNTIILQYSFILLAFVVIGFGLLFLIFSGSQYIPGVKTPGFGVNIDKIPQIKIYDAINYYLYTKIKIDGKDISLIELIPLYCFNLDGKAEENIKKMSLFLFPDIEGIHISCSLKKCQKEDTWLGESLSIYDPGFIQIGRVALSRKSVLVNLPKIPQKNQPCLLISDEFKSESFIDSTYSEKEFESKVKQKSLFKDSKTGFLISPSNSLWAYSDDLWCNPLEQAGWFSDCAEGISAQELINCKGDYQLCKK